MCACVYVFVQYITQEIYTTRILIYYMSTNTIKLRVEILCWNMVSVSKIIQIPLGY